MRMTHREKLLLALANARESLGRDSNYPSSAMSKLNTLRGVNQVEDTRESNLLSRTGGDTRPKFDIVDDQVLGKTPNWKPSIDLEEGESSLAQIVARRISEMREKLEFVKETKNRSVT